MTRKKHWTKRSAKAFLACSIPYGRAVKARSFNFASTGYIPGGPETSDLLVFAFIFHKSQHIRVFLDPIM